MITFSIIRKIGKMLRGGAGRKEIILGTLCGVLIGFNPETSLTLVLSILLTLLLNANISFTLLGAAVGKVLGLFFAAASFHTGFFIIHNLGMEDLFRSLCNAPVTALMDLNVYAMIGSLPYALASGLILGSLLGTTVVRVRKKMLEANQHEIIGKTIGNRISRCLLWMAFGKSKLSLDEEVITTAPLLRKSGLMLVAVVIVVGIAFEFFLFDLLVRKGIESSISSATGAEVNIADAHFSLARGEITIKELQVTDPEKPSHNVVQIDHLVADLDVGELLSRSYAIDLLACSTLKRDVPRTSPGAVYEKPKEPAKKEIDKKEAEGKSLDEYFAQAKSWQKYGEKAYEFLRKHGENAAIASRGEVPKASKETALADAKKLGFLKASADLVADRPAWLVHRIRIDQVDLGANLPEQTLEATEVCSHPELNRKATTLTMTPVDESDPSAKIILRFDDPAARHALEIKFTGIALDKTVETSDSFPLDIRNGQADIRAAGWFSCDALDIPFTLLVHNLKANVEEDRQVMGMDSATASDVLNALEQLTVEGVLAGTLLAPRVQIDYEKLSANVKTALLNAGKKELANRANAEMDKATNELKAQAGQEINKLLEGESAGDKAKSTIKKLF